MYRQGKRLWLAVAAAGLLATLFAGVLAELLLGMGVAR